MHSAHLCYYGHSAVALLETDVWDHFDSVSNLCKKLKVVMLALLD